MVGAKTVNAAWVLLYLGTRPESNQRSSDTDFLVMCLHASRLSVLRNLEPQDDMDDSPALSGRGSRPSGRTSG